MSETSRRTSTGTLGRLAGKRAFVTGAGSGIGKAIALRFVLEGAQVALIDVDGQALHHVSSEAGGPEWAIAVRADVTSESEVKSAVVSAVAAFGGMDIVVANAGVQLFGQDAPAHELDIDVWRRTLDVNLTGAFLTCKHGIAALLDERQGSVILTGSPTGLVGRGRGFTAYSASKAGVHGLMRVLAGDYAARGIRVNAVIPGFTRTGLVGEILNDAERYQTLLSEIPLQRPGEGEDVSSVAAFLASDEAAYVTGAFYTVDGGLTAV